MEIIRCIILSVISSSSSSITLYLAYMYVFLLLLFLARTDYKNRLLPKS